MANRTTFTAKKKQDFIDLLRENPNVSAASRTVGISRRTAYDQYKADAEFAADWDNAVEEGVDALEAEARRRALSTSDTLLIFLLKAHRPDKYRETVRQEHTGKDGAGIEINFRLLGAIPPPDHDNG